MVTNPSCGLSPRVQDNWPVTESIVLAVRRACSSSGAFAGLRRVRKLHDHPPAGQRFRRHAVEIEDLHVVGLRGRILEVDSLAFRKLGSADAAGGNHRRFRHVATQHLPADRRERAHDRRHEGVPDVAVDALRVPMAGLGEDERRVPALQAEAIGTVDGQFLKMGLDDRQLD